jgi:hypothetical protein
MDPDNRGAKPAQPDEAPMKSVTLEIDEATDQQLSLLSERCDTTPGHVVDLLCGSLDRETLVRLIQGAIRDDSVTSEPGVARMPPRRSPL